MDSDVLSARDAKESLAKNVAEAELQKRIQELQRQLLETTDALNRIRSSGGEPTEEQGNSISNSDSMTVSVPVGKRGYLFKWQDRSIGWGGTKWALRFVSLEGGKISYYRSHSDPSPRYVLTLRGCAVRDEGLKKNNRHTRKQGKGIDPLVDEVGAYFHVFSIFQRADSLKDGSEDDSDSEHFEVVPLLRFSTPSLAEKMQWTRLISEACAYCDTDAFLADEAASRREMEKRREQEIAMAMAMPEAKRGTLPPLYFAPAPPPPVNHGRHGNKRNQPRLYRTKSGNLDVETVESRSTKGYPPSKPMHRVSGPSYLSEEAPMQNYRGFFNLAMILLVVSNFRLILDTTRRHGFVLMQLQQLPSFSRDPWEDFPFVSGHILMQCFIIGTYAIEWLLSRRKLNAAFGIFLHYVNVHACFVTSMAIVWNFIDSPFAGGILLIHAAITWMKMLSYVHANEDYRVSADSDAPQATLALVEDLDPGDAKATYPSNVKLSNMYYFWCAPTLTYQIAFPRSPRVKIWRVVGILFRLFMASTLLVFLVAQVITPSLDALVKDLEVTHGVYTATMFADYGLKLSIANTYAWLLIFYIYFHLYLNLFAELLRFGDRVFYKDWWNSSEVSAYWRLWNMPVHYWLVRHVYFPCVRLGMSRHTATFMVFLISAVMHEILISVPFHMIRPWSFIGMMMQMPLVGITKYLCRMMPGSSIGNVIFWITFCVVGQPMAILLYTVDYQYGKQMSIASDETLSIEQCLAAWGIPCKP